MYGTRTIGNCSYIINLSLQYFTNTIGQKNFSLVTQIGSIIEVTFRSKMNLLHWWLCYICNYMPSDDDLML